MVKLLIVILSLISVSIYGQSNLPNLVGEWKSFQASDNLLITFDPDSTFTMANTSKKQSIGGRDLMRKGKSVRLIYLIDTSQQPAFIDLVIVENDTKNEQGRMKGIIEIVNDDQIKLNLGEKGDRPTEFGEMTLFLTRKR